MIRCWCARCPQAGYALDSRAAAEGEVEGGKGMSTWKSKRKRKKQWNDATLFFFSFYPLLSAHPLSFSSVHIRTQRHSQKRDNFAFLTITKLIYLNAARSTLRCASYETGTHTHTQSARTHALHNAYSINMQKRMRKKSSKVKSFTHKLSIGNNSKQPLRSSWQGGGDKTRQVVIDMRQCVHTASRNVKNVGDTTVNKHVHTCMCAFTCVVVCECVGFCSRLELLKYSHHYEPRLRTQAAQKAL